MFFMYINLSARKRSEVFLLNLKKMCGKNAQNNSQMPYIFSNDA